MTSGVPEFLDETPWAIAMNTPYNPKSLLPDMFFIKGEDISVAFINSFILRVLNENPEWEVIPRSRGENDLVKRNAGNEEQKDLALRAMVLKLVVYSRERSNSGLRCQEVAYDDVVGYTFWFQS